MRYNGGSLVLTEPPSAPYWPPPSKENRVKADGEGGI